jgi:FkbM family methyltransferase
MLQSNEETIVADVGARYGVHPSWNGYDAPLRYVAFEPDSEEADRLRDANQSTEHYKYEVREDALDKEEGTRDFHLLSHRGLSSFLVPDMTSECFRHLKPGQAEIEKIIPIKTIRLDDLFESMGVVPDFLKVDTEGTEHDVMEGADRLYDKGVLGVRSSCNFQPCFIGQKLFSESHDYMLDKGFILLNLDYRGYGYPRLGLFRKPDPIENEDFRYGTLVAADAVWIRRPEWIYENYKGADAAIAIMKLGLFCMYNNAPDLGIDIVREAAEQGVLGAEVENLRLYKALRIKMARFLGRWRTVPDEQWEKASGIFKEVFSHELMGGSGFYPQMNHLVKDMG